ncbi:unnamed protein product [Auanema sp. JU1783]|nr:unnamed protein product [Auanema sp. JU1783]
MPVSETEKTHTKVEDNQGEVTPSNHSGSSSSVKGKKLIIRPGSNKRSLRGNIQEPQIKRSLTAMDDNDRDIDMDTEQELDNSLEDALSQVENEKIVSNFSVPSTQHAQFHNGMTQSKKLQIRNYRESDKRSREFDTMWALLESSVNAINKHEKVLCSYESLYRTVYNLCRNEGPAVYDKLQALIKSHVVVFRHDLFQEVENNMSNFLEKIERVWTDFCSQVTMIRSIFIFLDRAYVLQQTSVLSIWEMSLTLFRIEILQSSLIKQRIVTDVLKLITDERMGKQVDRCLIKSILRMLCSLQIYQQVFEEPFFRATETLFRKEGENYSQSLEASDYIRYVDKRLQGEVERVSFYLDDSSRVKLFEITENCLITDHMQQILNRGLDRLLEDHNIDDLALMFILLTRVKEGQVLLKNGFVAYIKRVGKSLVLNPERDRTMVEDLMVFKTKMDTIVQKCFGNQDKFLQALRDSFDYFINTRPNKPAELVAKFMDAKMRSANKEASDEELDQLMDKAITLFRFIQGKDVFEAFYKKDLAKRLLLGRSASVDAEKSMLSKLKQECGAGFTHKLEGMFKDMEVSKDLALAFRQHNEHEAELGKRSVKMDFCVNILTSGQWPPYDAVDITLPCDMAQSLKMYQDFYISKHNGRKLQWQHSLGQCMLKGVFRPNCVKELQVSLYQAVVLLLFNDCQEYSTTDIGNATKIEAKELKRTLLSLACGKVRVLQKTPKSKDIHDDDKFTVNNDLQERLYRIKISQVQLKETEEEQKQTEEQVNLDRQYQIDAAVVRIMKTRKVLSHQQLINELFAQLRFPVKSTDLKKRIGSLMEREYLCRDNEDTTLYKYVS